MSRSGYSDDWDYEADQGTQNLYRATVDRSLSGKRGQAFLRSALDVLDAMPEKKLAASTWIDGCSMCTLGAVAKARGVEAKFATVDPEWDGGVYVAAKEFDISKPMAREIVYMNDEGGPYYGTETDEQRWQRMRNWIAQRIAQAKASP